MAQRKAESTEKEPEKDIIEFMNSVLHDLEKIEKNLEKLTEINVQNQNKLSELEARISTIEQIPLLASHIRTQTYNAIAAS